MDINNIADLQAKWKKLFSLNEPNSTTSDVATGRALAYQIGVGILDQHLTGFGATSENGFAEALARVVPSHLSGAKMPEILMPQMFGIATGTMFALFQQEKDGSISQAMEEIFREETSKMAIELIAVITGQRISS